MAKLRRVVLEPSEETGILWCWYLYGRETLEHAELWYDKAVFACDESHGLERPRLYRHADGRPAYWETYNVEYLDWDRVPEAALVIQARDRLQRRMLRAVRATLGTRSFATLWKLTYED